MRHLFTLIAWCLVSTWIYGTYLYLVGGNWIGAVLALVAPPVAVLHAVGML